MMYASIFIFLLMLVLNLLFKFASIFRLGVPLAYGLFVLILFPKLTQQHETLSTAILFMLLGLVALSWVYTVRKRVRNKRRQRME